VLLVAIDSWSSWNTSFGWVCSVNKCRPMLLLRTNYVTLVLSSNRQVWTDQSSSSSSSRPVLQ